MTSGFECLFLPLQAGDFGRLNPYIVMRGLGAKTRKQFFAPNPVRKAGAIVAGGDKRRAAAAAIHHHDLAPEAGEIDGGRQSRRSSAYDQAVEAAVAVPAVVAAALVAIVIVIVVAVVVIFVGGVGERLIALGWNGNPRMSVCSKRLEEKSGEVLFVSNRRGTVWNGVWNGLRSLASCRSIAAVRRGFRTPWHIDSRRNVLHEMMRRSGRNRSEREREIKRGAHTEHGY